MDLLRALQPDVQFAASDFTVSLRKGAISHSEESFEICFISHSFDQSDLQSFFQDMDKIGRKDTCLFVRIDEEVADDFDRSSAASDGFVTVVSRKGSHADKEALTQALQNRFFVKEESKRKIDVDSMMQMLLKEIDRTASDRRRGVDRKLVAIPMDGIELDVQFSEKVMQSYFESLEKRTGEAQPRTVDRLHVPAEVLKRALPNLTKDGYKGASHRVWELLAQKYGVKIGEEPPPEPVEPTTTDAAPLPEPEVKESSEG